MVIINFQHTYDLLEVAPDFSSALFNSIDVSGKTVTLKVNIKLLGDMLLPNVYNLSFGPLKSNGDIDDEAKIHHQDRNRAFSTILFFCLVFLQEFPHITIGLDGSNDVRAYLYHRMFLSNRQYLGNYFVATGVDWHVRLLRNGTVEMDADGLPFFKPRPEPFDYNRSTGDLYRYYMFRLL